MLQSAWKSVAALLVHVHPSVGQAKCPSPTVGPVLVFTIRQFAKRAIIVALKYARTVCDLIAPRWFEFYVYPDRRPPAPSPRLAPPLCIPPLEGFRFIFPRKDTLKTATYSFSRPFLSLVKTLLNCRPSSPESSPPATCLCGQDFPERQRITHVGARPSDHTRELPRASVPPRR